MNKADIKPGRDYALREKAADEFKRIRVLEHVRRDKWKVEWRDENPGLVDYVRSSTIICPWGERKAVARDERNAAEMRRETDRTWPGNDHPVDIAVNEGLEASGENITVYRGVLEGLPDAVKRVAARAGYEIPAGVGYTDRHGEQHLPWRIAVELAKVFAGAEPTTVLLHIEITERKWEIQAREPGSSYLLGPLENYRAGWTVVRQWASFDADRGRLDKEVDRLRQLVNRAVWDLRRPDADADRIAAQLDRGLRGD